MRKSLGDKRKEISTDQIADLVRLYGDFETGDRCKIFDNEDFGFLRITVERPLRLRWEVTDDGIEQLKADKRFAKLTEAEQATILTAAVPGDDGPHLGSSADDAAIRSVAKTSMKRAGVSGIPIENAIVDAFALADPEAATISDKKGNQKPDAELRDAENVPLSVEAVGRTRYEPDVTERLASPPYRERVDQYLEAEVLRYVPDAWIDYSKTKIGYEIPLTRHFYVYKPPRSLAEIDAEIKQLETEIQELITEVTE